MRAPERPNVSPMESPQLFGQVDVYGHSGELTVSLRAQGGSVLFRKVLQPGRVGQWITPRGAAPAFVRGRCQWGVLRSFP